MKNLFFALLLICMVSCSTSDSNVNIDENDFAPINAKVLGTDSNQVILFEIDTQTAAFSQKNLTDALGVPGDYGYAKYANQFLSFGKRIDNDFDFWRYNIASETGESFGQFCELEPNEGVLRASNALEKYVVFSRISASETLFNYIHVYNTEDSSYARSFFATGGLGASSIWVLSDRLALVYMYGSTGVELYKIDLTTLEVMNMLTLGTDARITVNKNDIHIFYDSGFYKKFSLDSFEQTLSGAYNFVLANYSFGFFETQFSDDQMLIDISYPQPSTFIQGPALVQLDTGQLTAGDDFFLFGLRDDLGTYLGEDVQGFSTYKVDLPSNNIVIGYVTNQNKFGLAFTNFEGEIIATTALPLMASEIFLN